MFEKLLKGNFIFYRWFVSICLLGYFFVDLLLSKNRPSNFHIVSLLVLLVFGVVDKFNFMKIPGIIELRKELREKTKKIDDKLEKIIFNQQNTSQSQNMTVNTTPTNMPSQPAETKTLLDEDKKT